ncbi:MAG: 5-bromo-4-chloroindolyl phosphate hydrolysis family protein [Oscillospiraceae bacterium]|jgi:hypothetical protein|nr:5-bromo-4-chloroindolyl phosphate hydrolysis family protein [Oscillospiraceae bacterium]
MAERDRNNGKKEEHGIGGWIATIIMLFVFWPIGLFMLIGRLRDAARFFSGTGRAAPGSPAETEKSRPQEVTDTPVVRQKPDKQKSKKSKERKTKTGTAAERLEKERKDIKGFNILLIATMALAGLGFGRFWDLGTFSAFISMLCGAVASAAVAGARGFYSVRVKLRRKYLAKLGASRFMRVSEFAASLGRSEKKVRRELGAMIDDGYFGDGAYIDLERGALVLDGEAAETVREKPDASQNAARGKSGGGISEYDRVLRELRSLNEKISDITISYKIERVEAASAKIFAAVEENPEKLPQIRRFMNYYLPTTLKLLRSYATLERQGIRGENITTVKEQIDRVLGTLASGFEQQLDRLFSSEAIDISSDIEVLESMMARDGLSGESPFKQQTSTGEAV